MIGVVKKQMQRSSETRRYSYEIFALLQGTAQIVTSIPLAKGAGSVLNPLTLADLMMGLAMAGVLSIQF
jgi:hypothetical protein